MLHDGSLHLVLASWTRQFTNSDICLHSARKRLRCGWVLVTELLLPYIHPFNGCPVYYRVSRYQKIVIAAGERIFRTC